MDVGVVESSEDRPDVNSKFAESLGADWGGGRRGRGHLVLSPADVEFDDFEVLDVGDEPISILIHTLEDEFRNIGRAGHVQKLIGIIDEFVELFQGHQPFCSPGHLHGFMFSLQAHLAAVSFEEEVAKFDKGDGSGVVSVDSEHIFHDIVNLALGLFLEHIDDNLLNGFDVDLVVFVEIGREEISEVAPESFLESVSCTLHVDLIAKDMFIKLI